MKIKLAFGLLIVMFLVNCEVKPKPINYGLDACQSCKMTIVDETHAAELVTTKGKAYTYDAIECMLRDLPSKTSVSMKYILVADYESPANLIDAKEATFLVSGLIKSPMGANLTAFENEKSAKKYLNNNTGELYNWNEIQALIK